MSVEPGGRTPIRARRATSRATCIRSRSHPTGVDPHLRQSTGDPGLPRVGRRRLRPAPPPDARHLGAQAGLERRSAHWEVELDRRAEPLSRTSSSARSDCSAPQGIPTSRASPTSRAMLMHTCAVGRARRPGRQAGGGRRHGGKWCAGRPRTRRHGSATDGLPAHAALDGAEGGPSVQRRRAGAVPSVPVGRAAGTVAAVEDAARQHRVDPRPSAAGRGPGVVGELSAAPCRRTRRCATR